MGFEVIGIAIENTYKSAIVNKLTNFRQQIGNEFEQEPDPTQRVRDVSLLHTINSLKNRNRKRRETIDKINNILSNL